MMTTIPETRQSLILRLPNRADAEAWDRFVAIYEPLVYRLARIKGFQDADAREVVQEVLVAVCRAVDRWDPNVEKGRFRDWLFRIARNLMINVATRKKFRSLAKGDDDLAELLEQQADPGSEESEMFDLEYRRELFHWVSGQVRRQVLEKTWEAFRLSLLEGTATDQVGEQLGMTVGAVRVARSRVIARIRKLVDELEQGGEQGVLSARSES